MQGIHNLDHAQARSATNIIGRFINRYPNNMHVVYLLIHDKYIDTRSPERKRVFKDWLDTHSTFDSIVKQIEGERIKKA